MFVYVREAFPAESRWPAPIPDGGSVRQPLTLRQRSENAERCLQAFEIGPRCLIDDLTNSAARAYGAFPFRMFLIAEGRVVVRAPQGAAGFEIVLEESRTWLEERYDGSPATRASDERSQ